MTTPSPLTYDEFQRRSDAAYLKGWKEAPQKWQESAEKFGLSADINHAESLAIERNESSQHDHFTPDMAELLDSQTDEFIEKYGSAHTEAIRGVMEEMQAKMKEQAKRNDAEALGRVALYLANASKKNVVAMIHGLLHCIPGMAAHLGFPSLRASGRACGCSQEWMRKCRDKWCADLDLPIPKEASKSDEAKAKYKNTALGLSLNGKTHWRKQRFKPNTHE